MNADYVISGLVQRGVPMHVAQGIAMNVADESGFNPTAVGDNGNAYGLAQWNGPRMRSLYDFAARSGMDPSDPNLQLDFLMYELQGPEAKAWARLQGTSSPGEAAAIFLNDFERPAESHRARREAAYLGGSAPSYGGTSYGGSSYGNALSAPQQPPQNALATAAPQIGRNMLDVTPFLRLARGYL
jgi:hypothetical protein